MQSLALGVPVLLVALIAERDVVSAAAEGCQQAQASTEVAVPKARFRLRCRFGGGFRAVGLRVEREIASFRGPCTRVPAVRLDSTCSGSQVRVLLRELSFQPAAVHCT